MRRRSAEPENEMMAFLAPFMQMSVVGIQNKMNPKEVVDYFMGVMKEFMNRTHEIENMQPSDD